MSEKSTLFDQSYQEWHGKLQPHPLRVVAIVLQGVKNTWRRSPLGISLLGGFAILLSLPNAFLGLMMPGMTDPAFNISAALSGSLTWTYLLMIPMVGSGLIASDVKHNALLMYFSKSIVRADYVAGKILTAAAFLALPLLLAPMLAVGISIYGLGTAATNAYSIRLFLGLLVCVPIALLPGIAIIMAFSSCTRRTFLAGVGWVVLYLVLETVSAILTNAAKLPWGYLVSISNNVFRLTNAILPSPPPEMKVPPMPPEMSAAARLSLSAWYSAGILGGLVAIGIGIVIWRLSNTERRS